MRKHTFFIVILLLVDICASPSSAVDVIKKYEKIIWIDQIKQIGAVYEQGENLGEFPIITGDDETPTPPGIYVIKVKDADYYSRKYDTPCLFPYFSIIKEGALFMKAKYLGLT